MGLKEEREQHAEAGEHTADWVPPCSSIILMGLVNSVGTSKLVLPCDDILAISFSSHVAR